MNRLFTALVILLTAVSCVDGGNKAAIGKVWVPWNISAEGYPAHVHLNWINNVGSTYDVYRANKSGKFVHCAQDRKSVV